MPLYIITIFVCFIASLVGAVFTKESRRLPMILFPAFLLLTFFGIVATAIIIVGYLFNALL